MSCGDARSIVDCNSCRFKIECEESDLRRKYIGMQVSKCSNEASENARLGFIKYCDECGAPMRHGIVPKNGNIQWAD